MRISIIILSFLLLIVVANNQASFAVDAEITTPQSIAREEARQKQMAQERDMLERQQQLPAIISAFKKRTNAERANRLAYLCYETTLDTPFKPIDLAEIALAETGGHGLSGNAVSSRGAVGVWQLMPVRARSHGYEPSEMKRDDKCAAAAVKELKTKLAMADGDLSVAKRLYCGTGKQARAYDLKIRRYRREILGTMAKLEVITQGS